MPLHNLVPWRKSGAPQVRSLQEEVNRLFDDFFGGPGELLGRGAAAFPTVDVSESDADVTVVAEVPGMTEKDIRVSLSGDVLTLSGEKKEEREDQKRDYHRVERSYGSFSRSVPLPAPVDAGKAQAAYKNGLLTITLPKTARAQARKIAVTTE